VIFITPLARFLQEAEKKELYRYLVLCGGIVLVLIALFFYWHFSTMSSLQSSFSALNKARTETRRILQEHTLVQQQQDEVNAILEKDKNFIIADYFTTLLEMLQLKVYNSKEPSVSVENLNNGYIEEKLDAGFTNMNMQQLCQLLDKIERNERIYTKELSITKALKSPTIDVTLTIATLALEKKATAS
jgi:hypothetical protein